MFDSCDKRPNFSPGIRANRTSEVLSNIFSIIFYFYTCTFFFTDPSIDLCSKELCSITANSFGQSFLLVLLIMRTGAVHLSLELTNVLNRTVS
jgi:hypothetical protein